MNALHVVVEAAIVVGLIVFVLWLLRELGRWSEREIQRHVDCALGDLPVRQQDVAATREAYARWSRTGTR